MKVFFRLVGYELRKAFLSPWVLLFLGLLLLLNSWKLREEYESKLQHITPYEEVYEDFYSRWKGPITPENIAQLMELYGPLEAKLEEGTLNTLPDENTYTGSQLTDYYFFSTSFFAEMQYDYLYQNTAIRIGERAESLEKLYSTLGNPYEVKKNEAVAETFQGRIISQFSDTHWVEVWLNHDYSAMLVLLLCIFGLCSVFVTERETQMYMLQRTTKLGGGFTVAAKLLASGLFVFVVSGLFFAQDSLLLLLFSGHPEALESPVYAIRYLETTPLRMTVGQFLLWATAVKTLGILGCAACFLLLSCLCKRVLTAFVAGFGCTLALTMLQELCRSRYGLKWFNPMELVLCRELVAQTEFVKLLGQPVLLHHFVLGGAGLTVGLLCLGILVFHPGRRARR